MGDPSLVKVSDATHELLEEEAGKALWKRALCLEHVMQVAGGSVFMHNAKHCVCKKDLQL